MKTTKKDHQFKNGCNLYYHQTGGGAEYLTNKFILCPDGSKEGVFQDSTIIIRLDGKEPEVHIRFVN